MSAKNIDHDAVRAALIADGWTITDDPLRVPVGRRNVFIDLAIERELIVAERGIDRIAVEIQSFVSKSQLYDFHAAIGQYLVYRSCMKAENIQRRLYLAIPEHANDEIWSERIGSIVRQDYEIRLVVYANEPPRVIQWIEPPATATS